MLVIGLDLEASVSKTEVATCIFRQILCDMLRQESLYCVIIVYASHRTLNLAAFLGALICLHNNV